MTAIFSLNFLNLKQLKEIGLESKPTYFSDFESYAPKNPVISLAPKPNGNYRVVHQLDPIDSIVFTALLYEAAPIIEAYRIPEARKIACSYRIKPDTNGSFFDSGNIGFLNIFLKKQRN